MTDMTDMADMAAMVWELDDLRRTNLDTLPADEWIERSSDPKVLWLRMNEINTIMFSYLGTIREGAMRGSFEERLAWIYYIEALAKFKMALDITHTEGLVKMAGDEPSYALRLGLTWGRDEFIDALTELKTVIYESESE